MVGTRVPSSELFKATFLYHQLSSYLIQADLLIKKKLEFKKTKPTFGLVLQVDMTIVSLVLIYFQLLY